MLQRSGWADVNLPKLQLSVLMSVSAAAVAAMKYHFVGVDTSIVPQSGRSYLSVIDLNT